ncbi:adenine phosphoribosyltransferase [Glaciihabitans sp. dw_435]|uniref:adenine phosphoribosyltransferase n=1 Tax=Glaciihabitans sp. dw_435 TaxID=2720081 RepID=UPI001BD33739|nr:adenine phosphoribosyltransferase [Glaciihabitans sp. dw_435]
MNTPSATELIESLLGSVPDFPSPGIIFRDLTPVFANAEAFRAVIDELTRPFAGQFDIIAGVEARGFLLAAGAAYATGTGTLAVRKAGKLPPPVLAESYSLEYGSASLEIHPVPAVSKGQRLLIVDDVLATGGTLAATIRLAERAGYDVIGIAVVLELDELAGRQALGDQHVHRILGL